MRGTTLPALWRGMLVIALLAASSLTGGCKEALLPGQGAPPKLFDLTPKSTFPDTLPAAKWQLVVETPNASAALNTVRIAVKHNNLTLNYYANSAWTDVAPRLVQTLIVESFENSGKIVSVGYESATLRSDYLLKTELREFQAEYNGAGPPTVVVRINAKMIKMPQRIIVAGEDFERKAPAADDTLEAVVNAFDEALGKVLKELVIWTLEAPTKVRRSS